LISAYKFIKKQNQDEQGNSTLSPEDRRRLMNNFAGYDISPDMVRLSRVNMYLHGFSNPNISEYDTLTSLDKWDDTYDVIFANINTSDPCVINDHYERQDPVAA
jgi:type I restriction enzyme M protein